jgi:transposase
LSKGKSDRKHAQWLRRYGPQQPVKVWQPDETMLVECRPLEQVTEQVVKQKTMVCHALEALTRQPVIRPVARQRLEQTKRLLEEPRQAVETELLALLEQRFAPEMALLCSIPGIGRKTAGLLLLAGGFARLDTYRPQVAKAGLSPREHTCGSSLRGRGASPRWAAACFAANCSCGASRPRNSTPPAKPATTGWWPKARTVKGP